MITDCQCEHCKELRRQQRRAEERQRRADEKQNQRRLKHAYELLLQNHFN